VAAAIAVAALIALVTGTGRGPGSRVVRGLTPPAITNATRFGNEGAAVHYERALAIDPQSSDAHAGLATAYAFRANYLPNGRIWTGPAITLASRATALDPTSASAFKALGTAHAKAGDLDAAIASYRRALELLPEEPGIQNNLGLVLREKGDLSEALGLFERRVLARPDNAAGLVNLADTLQLAGFGDEAVAVAQRALVLEPYARGAQLVLARREMFEGRYDHARRRLLRQLSRIRLCGGRVCPADGSAVRRSDVSKAWYREAIAIRRSFWADHFSGHPPFNTSRRKRLHPDVAGGCERGDRQGPRTPALR
jgi:Tfp pilus assembly protein PilF